MAVTRSSGRRSATKKEGETPQPGAVGRTKTTTIAAAASTKSSPQEAASTTTTTKPAAERIVTTEDGKTGIRVSSSEKRMYNQLKKIQEQANTSTFGTLRYIAFAMILGFNVQKYILRQHLLPWGPALSYGDTNSDRTKPKFAEVDYANDLLQEEHGRTQRIYERIAPDSQPVMHGPETVVIDPVNGNIYVLTDTAKFVQLSDFETASDNNVTILANATIVKDLGMGRPLGGALTYHPASSSTSSSSDNSKNNKNNKKNKNNNNIETNEGPTLYVADAVLGLLRIKDINDPKSKVEIVASYVNEDVITINTYFNTSNQQKTVEEIITIEETPILYANDVTIGPKTGKVYFTDSTNIAPDRIKRKDQHHKPTRIPTTSENTESSDGTEAGSCSVGTEQTTANDIQYTHYQWDTMYGAKLDLFRRGPSGGTGRLLEYDPTTDQVRVLARGFYYANGVSVISNEEEDILVVETFGPRLYKYNIATERLDIVVDNYNFPGYIDGADCILSTKPGLEPTLPTSTICYAVIPGAILPLNKIIVKLPDFFSRIIRTLLMLLPRSVLPKIKPFGAVMEINITAGSYRLLLDPVGRDLRMLTGVTHSNGKLYFGSLTNDFIGVYDILSK